MLLLLLVRLALGAVTDCVPGVDYPYGDLPSQPTVLDSPDPILCAQMCDADPRCNAFAYVKPDCYATGEPPWCYLKGQVQSQASNPCVCAGLKTTPPPPVAPSPPSNGAVLYTIKNSQGWTVSLDRRGVVQVYTGVYRVNVSGDAWGASLDSIVIFSNSLPDPSSSQASDGSVHYVYKYNIYTFEVVYELKDDWTFVSKYFTVSTSTPSTNLMVEWIDVFQGLTLTDAGGRKFVDMTLPLTNYGALATFMRFGSSQQSPDMGVFALVQTPFVTINMTGLGNTAAGVTINYPPYMLHNFTNPGGPFRTDTGCLSVYTISGSQYGLPQGIQISSSDEMPFVFPNPAKGLVPPKINRPGRDGNVFPSKPDPDAATMYVSERDQFITCATAFFVAPPNSTVKVHIPWTENDYQVDISNSTQAAEWQRILSRLKDIGLTNTLFTPQNSDVSSRSDCTDSWCWEEVLWLTLGEKIRTNQWIPGKDAIPPTVQNFINSANQLGIALVPYIYPSLAFQQNPAWISPAGDASLANVDFQNWLINTIAEFNAVTGSRGAGFDYTWLDDSSKSTYAQWFGWRRILTELRTTHGDVVRVIDNRQANHVWSLWMWIAGSYAEPLMGDEQPESWMGYPVWDPHTDRLLANHLRIVNFQYSNYDFCPPLAMPGFFGHQTDRSDSNGVMYWTDYLTRDFDYLGYRYSLLSSIGTGGLNTVVNMLPARDLGEYSAFPDDDINWIRSWLEWTDSNRHYLLNTKFLLQSPAIYQVDGTYSIYKDQGYVFLFNPSSRRFTAPTLSLSSLGFSSGVGQLVISEVYPLPRHITITSGGNKGTFDYGLMDGRGVVVLSFFALSSQSLPLLTGISGTPTLTSQSSTTATLDITNTQGEAGTTITGPVTIVIPSVPTVPTITAVTLNGQPIKFTQSSTNITIIQSITFAGTYFPQSSQIGAYNSTYQGGEYRATFTVPQSIFDQLSARNKSYPVDWTAFDATVSWLVPGRLLAFVDGFYSYTNAAKISVTIDGVPLPVLPIYNARGTLESSTFVGNFFDLTGVTPDVPHQMVLTCPSLTGGPGTFQGVFFENVETTYTSQWK